MTSIADLSGKRGLVVGIANESSIAYGSAQAFRRAGAELAVTYLNAKAEPYVRPLAEALGSPIIMPCDVRIAGELEAVFERIAAQWGRLDFLFHAIAFAPREDLHTSLVNCSAEGFATAMDVSCHSFIRMTKLALPLMTQGGSLQTVSFYGADHVVENYNLMGPVKAALESTVRTLAADLAPRHSRHALRQAGQGALPHRPVRWCSIQCASATRSAGHDGPDRPGGGPSHQRGGAPLSGSVTVRIKDLTSLRAATGRPPARRAQPACKGNIVCAAGDARAAWS